MARKASSKPADSTANLGFEAKLWLAADKLRNNMDAAEPERSGDSQPQAARRASEARQYKHVVLGLIFLKYISDSFEAHHAKLVAGEGDYAGANPEDPDEYRAENIFWVPPAARWSHLQGRAKLPSIGKDVDDAMDALERDTPRLKGALNKNYGRADLDKHRLGELIDLIGSIDLNRSPSPQLSPTGRGTSEAEGEGKIRREKDILGRVFEYFLTQFASAEGKNGGQFYTPSCVVRLLVEMLAPYKGRIYDPACGSGGMFVQSEKFVESHGGKLGDISIYGQEKRAWGARFRRAQRARRVRLRRKQPNQSNPTTRRLAIMNLALRGIEADFGKENADTFRAVQHPDLRADTATRVSAKSKPRSHSAGLLRSERQLLANPPFNDSDWHRKDDDVRWRFGVPPKGNANFAWVQHFIHHLSPKGMAGFVLANGSMSSNQSGEGEIRKAIIEADLVDTALRDSAFLQSEATPQVLSKAKNNMVALPGQLFYSTEAQASFQIAA